jgi:hypothetical protein
MAATDLPEYHEYEEYAEPIHLLQGGPSSPPYSEEPNEHERALATPSAHPAPPTRLLSYDSEELWSSSHSYCYTGSMLSVTLGQRLWGIRLPAFGSQAEVQGAIRLGAKCSHTYQLSVSVCRFHPASMLAAPRQPANLRFLSLLLLSQLVGKLTVTASIRGAASNMFDVKIINETIDLPNPSSGEFYPTDHLYHFSLAFPKRVLQCDAPPPPTHTTWSPGMSCEVAYTLRVDAYRKGLRRHEQCVLFTFKLSPFLSAAQFFFTLISHCM